MPREPRRRGELVLSCPYPKCAGKKPFYWKPPDAYREGEAMLHECPRCQGLIILHNFFPDHALALEHWDGLIGNMTDAERERARSGGLSDAQIRVILKRASLNPQPVPKVKLQGRDF